MLVFVVVQQRLIFAANAEGVFLHGMPAMVQMNMEMQAGLQTVLKAQMRVLIVVIRDMLLTAIALH